MNTFFSSIFSKIISAIISILCLFNLAPVPNYDLSRPAYNPTPVVGEADETATHNNTPDLVKDENENKKTDGDAAAETPSDPDANTETNPNNNVIGDIYQIINNTQKENGDDAQPAEDTNKTETPAEEVKNDDAQQPTDETVTGDYEVLETIDISATENDNVTMKICAAPAKTQAAPMKAAGFSINAIDDETNEKATVRRTNDDAAPLEDGAPIPCELVIEGNGAMEDNVYRHFVSIEKYVKTLKDLILAEYNLTEDQIDCEYPEDATDILQVDAEMTFYLKGNEEEGTERTILEVTDNIRETLNPADMLAYTPNEITFAENSNVTTISEGAFLFCNDLSEITIPETVKTIGINAFSYCTNLTSVIIPEGVEVIDERAFMQCRNLTDVELPNSLKRIESNAFAYCGNLAEITLPAGIEYIGDNAFLNIAKDSRIICESDIVYKLANSRYVITRGRTTVEMI